MRKFPPVDSPLFEQWKNATMNDSLKKMDNHRIQKIKRVCNRHFTEKYRRKPCFFKYDFPMLTENIFDFGINILDDEDRKRIFGDNAHNLDHSFSKTDEVKSEELRIVDSDRAVDKNLIYLDHSYCRTVKVESGEMSIVDNSDRAIDDSVNNLDDSNCETVKVKSEEMSVVVDTDRDDWESEEEEESDYEFNGDLTINKEEILISRKQLERKICCLKNENKMLVTECRRFEKFKKLDTNVKKFFRRQVFNAEKKKREESYIYQDKAFALGIYKQSKKCYTLLSKIFKLPSELTLTTFHNLIRKDPDLDPETIDLRQFIIEYAKPHKKSKIKRLH